MPIPICDACGARLVMHEDDGGAVAGFCRKCDEQCCTECSAWHEFNGGYREDGQVVRLTLECQECRK